MPKLPRVSGSDAIRALEKLGFVQVRQRGSHVVMRRDSEAGAAGCVIRLHAELAMGGAAWHSETGWCFGRRVRCQML